MTEEADIFSGPRRGKVEIPFTGHQDAVLHWTNRAEYYRHGRSEGLLGELLMTGPAKASRQGSPERRDLSSTSGYLEQAFHLPVLFFLTTTATQVAPLVLFTA